MANMIEINWTVVLPNRYVPKFHRFLIYESDSLTAIKKKQFLLTWIYEGTLEISPHPQGYSCIRFSSECKWNMSSVLHTVNYPDEGITAMSIEYICKACKVSYLEATGTEYSMCFRETLRYDKNMDDHVSHSSFDINVWHCDICGSYGCFEDYPYHTDDSVCPECGCKFEED